MSARGRRRGHTEEEDVHPDERWMASYMDMVTVLMCLFIVLFAMSTVDQEKYTKLRDSLATGFGVVEEGKIDTAEGLVVPPENVGEEAEGIPETVAAAVEVDKLEALKNAISANLEARGLASMVRFEMDARGLTVRLVGSETFFGSNSADLSDSARLVLDSISPPVAASGRHVSVEGHADVRSSAAPYPTNWELSSARSTQVLRDMVERGGVPQQTIQAVGFGSARPLTTGTAPEELALNRRVDIVVLANASDGVSALVAEASAG